MKAAGPQGGCVGQAAEPDTVGNLVGLGMAACPQPGVEPRSQGVGEQQGGAGEAVAAGVFLEACGADEGVVERHQRRGQPGPAQPQAGAAETEGEGDAAEAGEAV